MSSYGGLPAHEGGCRLLIVEYTDPTTEFRVSGDDDATMFITTFYDLKEKQCSFPFEGDIAIVKKIVSHVLGK